jgi:hypothetical protein
VKVTLTTSGGHLAAINRRLPPKVVDTGRLSEGDAGELTRLVHAARAAEAPPRPQPDPARDAQSYRVVVEDEGGEVILTATDAAMSRDFAALLAWLERNAERAP